MKLMEAYPKFKEEGKKGATSAVEKLAYALTSGIVEMKEEEFSKEMKDDNSPGVVRQLKNQIKYGRSLGIHETPTFLVNGLITNASSGWDMPKWKEFLEPLLEAASK